MLTPLEFKQMPEWLKIENAIREALEEHEGNCVTRASNCDPHASVEAGWCFALKMVLELPELLLTPEINKTKKPTDNFAKGTRIIRAHPSPRI